MTENIKVNLVPIVDKINLPTVLKTAILPGETIERLFIATQVGEIYFLGNSVLETFLDISSRIITLGANGGYDERGLLGLAFHPNFRSNGLFYLHYSVAGTQGPGASPYSKTTGEVLKSFQINPCDPRTLNLKWINRETQYDHIDTVEEWLFQGNGQVQIRRTLLNVRRPFFNHNGVDSLNFSPETGKLILTTGDGGSGYDPFNLSQDDMEIAGKIIEIDVNTFPFINNVPVVTRFNELPPPVQDSLTVIVKGVRNIPGISFQKYNNQYIKYVGNVGQDLVESIYSFIHYNSVPISYIIQKTNSEKSIVNLGWRGWEGDMPTMKMRDCSSNPTLNEKIATFYNEAIKTSASRLKPLTCYYHEEPRTDKFSGSALTGVKVYMGNLIPKLTGRVIFTDWSGRDTPDSPRGVLGYTWYRTDGKQNDYGIIETNSNFIPQSNYYVSLGTNLDQSRIFLGVYGSAKVTDYNRGTIYEIVP